MRLLLLEDNERLLRLTRGALVAAGFDADGVATVADATAAMDAVSYSALILDLRLPDEDGITFLRRLRAAGNTIPVLILTARGGIEDRVLGLNAGADDYLVKPFAQAELLARIRALLRRPGDLLGERLRLGNLCLDTVSRELTVGATVQFLAPRETAVLELLLRRAGRVVPKKLVEEHLFGLGDDGGSNAVEVYVHRLRRELAERGADTGVHTIRGVGYLIAGPPK